jgi:dihydrodipicolinate synthase/N-acetylneuraminate lyase
MKIHDIPAPILEAVRQGTVIPAHPLVLDNNRRFDEHGQRVLTRYYVDAGAGGLAVGVHTTQFEIRRPEVDLYKPVLELAAETAERQCRKRGRQILLVAGVCGPTDQALREAACAQALGYHACLLSLSAWKDASVGDMLAHCRRVAEVLPLIGFYLQPLAGGRLLPYEFWRRFAEIDNVLAIKMAPFNRYQTLDVVRGVCDAGRHQEITLYTGNDDNIVVDLLQEYRIRHAAGDRRVRIKGGLLGHWAFWTSRAVELLKQIHSIATPGLPIPPAMLSQAAAITDCNAVVFDAAHGFSGCIPGIHEVLRRQGLMPNILCLNPHEALSPGQSAQIDRICRDYPELTDDEFVRRHLDEWKRD